MLCAHFFPKGQDGVGNNVCVQGIQKFRSLRDTHREIFLEILPLFRPHCPKLTSPKKDLLVGKSIELFFS